MTRFILSALILFIGLTSVTAQDSKHVGIDHSPWDQLLKKYVRDDGTVDYAGFVTDSAELNAYLETLSAELPDPVAWSTSDQIAFWINAYNAFTVKLVADNYPVESIKDIKRGIPMVNSVWDIKFINIGGEEFDLNKIEHKVLRKDHDEPRIHFAVNCASVSCPNLRAEAYTGDLLDQQLDEQAKLFLADPTKNEIASDKIRISKIFQWFKGDFTDDGTLIDFLNKYSPTQIEQGAKVSYLEYDWNLNG